MAQHPQDQRFPLALGRLAYSQSVCERALISPLQRLPGVDGKVLHRRARLTPQRGLEEPITSEASPQTDEESTVDS